MPSVDTITALADLAIVSVVVLTGIALYPLLKRFPSMKARPGLLCGTVGLALLAVWSLASLCTGFGCPLIFGTDPSEGLSRIIRDDLRWPITALAITLMAIGSVIVARTMMSLDEERLKSEAQLRRAVRLAKVGHWIWDHRVDRCIYASQEIATIFGTTVEEYVQHAQTFESELNWYPDGEREAYFKTVHEATLAGTGYELVTAIRRKSGEIRYIHELAEVETDGNGQAIYTYGTSRDITDAKKLEESLVAANDAKSDFLAHMSHELRTPLNSILGFSDILKEELLGPIGNAQYKEYITHISNSGQHLHAVLTDILDLSKIEAGAMEVLEERLGLQELVATCTAMSEGAALKKAISLNVSVPENTIVVLADDRLMRQAVFNILSNAIHYSPEKGMIDIVVRKEAIGTVAIVIRDNGPGIPEEDLEMVLRPFSQSKREPGVAHRGTGLGLSLSSRIMEIHGGNLDLQSTVGEGTEVTLRLPSTRILTANV